jgi:hypothetical protein
VFESLGRYGAPALLPIEKAVGSTGFSEVASRYAFPSFIKHGALCRRSRHAAVLFSEIPFVLSLLENKVFADSSGSLAWVYFGGATARVVLAIASAIE